MEIIFQNHHYEFKHVNPSTSLKESLLKIENFLLGIDNKLDVENLIKKYSELYEIKDQETTLSQLAKTKLKYRVGYNAYLLIHECFDEYLINYKNDFTFKKRAFPIKNIPFRNILSFLLNTEIKEFAKCSKMTMMSYVTSIIRNRLTESVKIINIKSLKQVENVEALVKFLGEYIPPIEPFMFDIIPLNQNSFLYLTVFINNILNITKYENGTLETLLRDKSFSHNLDRISFKKFTDVVVCSDDIYCFICYIDNSRDYFDLSNIHSRYDFVFEIDREHLGLIFSFNLLEVFNLTERKTEYIIDLFTLIRYDKNCLCDYKLDYSIPTNPNPPIYYFKSNHLYLITKYLTVYNVFHNKHVKHFKNIHSMLSVNEIDETNLLIESKKKFFVIDTKKIQIIKTIDKNDLFTYSDFYLQLKLSKPCLSSPFKKFGYHEIEENILLNCPHIPIVYFIRELGDNCVNVGSEKFNYTVDLDSYATLGFNIAQDNIIIPKPPESHYIKKLRNMSNLYSFYKRNNNINMSKNIKYYNPHCQETGSYEKTLYSYNRSSYIIQLYELPENLSDDNYLFFSNADLFYDVFEQNLIYEEYFYKEKHFVSFYDKINNKLINSIWIGNSSKIFFNKKGRFILEKENTLALFNNNFNLEKKINIKMKIENFEIFFENDIFIKFSDFKLFYWHVGKNFIQSKEYDEKILGVGLIKNILAVVCSQELLICDEDFNHIKSLKLNNMIENPIFIEVETPEKIIILNESNFQILIKVENEFQSKILIKYNKNSNNFEKINVHKIKKVENGLYILFSDRLSILDMRNYI